MIVSTAFHWSVRGRQFGGAVSASASTGKYGFFSVSERVLEDARP